ncbi:MAG TPA: hypothetical protein VND21_03760 [Planctomycetota bacterium]|jgi:hypothetical protein|nr:hypothetical protein [Planctomycetota bacterium]
MPRATLILIAILAAGMGMLLYAMKVYTSRFAAEIRVAKVVTADLADRLETGTQVKLARVEGHPKYVVADPNRPGLLLEAQPRRELWAKDPTGEAFAREAARRLFIEYGPDRPITWIQFRLTRPDKSEAPVFGLEQGAKESLHRVGPPGGK